MLRVCFVLNNSGVFHSGNINRQKHQTRAILVAAQKGILEKIAAINHKMVLTNIVQDAILYSRMNYLPVLKKFPNPTARLFRSTRL